jgi:secreted PhoX family phosphatase
VTGLTETADGKTLLVNIQHPGENTKALEQGPEYKFESQWPATAQGSQQYGPGQRPRSATLIITKLDGGLIGM